MVAERVPCLDAGRPPTPPPVWTTFAPGGDGDERDFLIFLKDRIDRLSREVHNLDSSRAGHWLLVVEAWRKAVYEEAQTESLFLRPDPAPLGIPEDPYDLRALCWEFEDPRLREYKRLLANLFELEVRLRAMVAD